MVKITFKPYGTLKIVIYQHIAQSTFIDIDPMIAIFFFDGSIHLSVFNDLKLFSYIVPKHFKQLISQSPLS
jgi:hypothetical protein